MKSDCASAAFRAVSDGLDQRLPLETPAIVLLGGNEAAFYERFWPSYVDAILERNDRSTYDHEWLELGEQQLGPLLPQLAGVKTVVLVPHGVLHRMPLHAMTCGGRPFIERFATVDSRRPPCCCVS